MKKTAIYLTFALALSILVFPFTSSGLGTASVMITSSGSITTITPIKLNNAVIIYGIASLTSAQIPVVANYDMLICDLDFKPATLQSIKALNPNIEIIGYANLFADSSCSYWSTVNANESWFLHTPSGHRIVFKDYPTEYLMDITSGWKQFSSSYINSQLNGTLFDGVLIDNVFDQIAARAGDLMDASTGASITSSDITPNSAAVNWHSGVISFLQYVKGNVVSGKIVVVNTDDYFGNTYLNVVDGEMAEGWVYATWVPLNYFDTLKSWDSLYPMDYIDAMAAASAAGKIYIAESSTPTGDTNLIAQTANYCYYAALLGLNGANCYFGFKVGSYTYSSAINYMPDTSASSKLGSPSGSYYLSQNVYMRNFADGLVLFNPSDNSYNVNLGGNYHLVNGTAVSSINLGAWSGVVLLP